MSCIRNPSWNVKTTIANSPAAEVPATLESESFYDTDEKGTIVTYLYSQQALTVYAKLLIKHDFPHGIPVSVLEQMSRPLSAGHWPLIKGQSISLKPHIHFVKSHYGGTKLLLCLSRTLELVCPYQHVCLHEPQTALTSNWGKKHINSNL